MRSPLHSFLPWHLKARHWNSWKTKDNGTRRFPIKATLGGSAFFLQQKGYMVLLNNKDDLRAIAYAYSGHDHDKRYLKHHITSAARVRRGKLTLHSHAYQVNFVGASEHPNIIPDKPINTYNNYFQGRISLVGSELQNIPCGSV